MTSETARSDAVVTSITEFGARQGAGQSAIGDMPRDDVLQYIQEMCATLSYMSVAHRCERLSGLLAAAAKEAEQCRPATDPSLSDRAGSRATRPRPADGPQ